MHRAFGRLHLIVQPFNHLYLQKLVPKQELAQRPAWQEQPLYMLCSPKQSWETLWLRNHLLPMLTLLPYPGINGRGRTVVLLGTFQKCIDSYCTSLILQISRFPCPGKFSGSVSFSKILEAIINCKEKNLEKAPKGRIKFKYCCHDIFNSNIKV